MGKDGCVSGEVRSVKYVRHIDESNVFVLPAKKEKGKYMKIYAKQDDTICAVLCSGGERSISLLICYALDTSAICIHVSLPVTLEKNGGHGPHSPQFAWVHSLSASRKRPSYKAPMKRNS